MVSVVAARETGISDEDWMQTQSAGFDELARSGRFPAFARTLNELHAGFELDFDQLFETGLGSLLDGFAELIGKRPSALP